LATEADVTNALFELVGGLFVCRSIVILLRDKMVRGMDWTMIAFFAAWGVWNLFYYPHLGQWWSFSAGVFIAFANVTYVCLLVHYSRR